MPNRTILLVDDDPGICDIVRAILEPEGYKVQTASNGEGGLALLHRIQPCLILLDLMMPVMDGWEFLKRMREDSSLAMAPVVIITAFGRHDQIPSGLEVIWKPFKLETLLAIVGRYCGEPGR